MDTFRILMVLPSVFTRGWDHFGRKMTPGGGGSRNPLFGVPGGPPPPPRGGGEGGTPPSPPCGGRPPGGGPGPPPGGVPPPPEGGETPAQKDPPLGYPILATKFVKEITRGEARYRFSTHSPVPCQR